MRMLAIPHRHMSRQAHANNPSIESLKFFNSLDNAAKRFKINKKVFARFIESEQINFRWNFEVHELCSSRRFTSIARGSFLHISDDITAMPFVPADSRRDRTQKFVLSLYRVTRNYGQLLTYEWRRCTDGKWEQQWNCHQGELDIKINDVT